MRDIVILRLEGVGVPWPKTRTTQHNTMHTAQNFRQIKRLVVCNRWDVSVAFRTAIRSDPTLLSTVPFGSKRWNLTPAGVCLTLEKWRLLDVGGGLVPGVQQALWSLQFVPVWVTWIITVVVSTHYIVFMYRDDIQLKDMSSTPW